MTRRTGTIALLVVIACVAVAGVVPASAGPGAVPAGAVDDDPAVAQTGGQFTVDVLYRAPPGGLGTFQVSVLFPNSTTVERVEPGIVQAVQVTGGGAGASFVRARSFHPAGGPTSGTHLLFSVVVSGDSSGGIEHTVNSVTDDSQSAVDPSRISIRVRGDDFTETPTPADTPTVTDPAPDTDTPTPTPTPTPSPTDASDQDQGGDGDTETPPPTTMPTTTAPDDGGTTTDAGGGSGADDPTDTASLTPVQGEESSGGIPGPGAVVALLAVIAGAALATRRR